MSSIWDILNFSDPITMVSDDFRAVAIATLALGQGTYGATEAGGAKREMPIFRFSSADQVEAWFRTTFPEIEAAPGEVLTELLKAVPKRDIARVLRTAQVCSVEERKSYQKALDAITDPAKKKEYVAWWKDERRSSLNDIAALAWRLADKMDDDNMAEERQSGAGGGSAK